MTPEVAKFLKTYPGDVNKPMELQIDPAALKEIGAEYGHIVTFGLVDGQPQKGVANGFYVHAIHPEQKYVLVPPKADI
jgi:hypothetical protein